MRVQCDVCESAAAAVICCADEAALCLDCDKRVHAANKLASKHQRVPLVNNSCKLPLCDICQEKTAFIFCVEDRALLCRDCDVSIHSPNTLASGHQRFLATGIRIALNAIQEQDAAKVQGTPEVSRSLSTGLKSSLHSNPTSPVTPSALPCIGEFMDTGKKSFSSTSGSQSGFVDSVKQDSGTESWRVEEVLNLPDLASGYSLGDIVSSKTDLPTLGDYDWMADLSIFDEHIYAESLAEVPQISPSSLTINGWARPGKLNVALKGKIKQDMALVPEFDDAFVVPDLGLQSDQVPPPPPKRRKTFLEV